MKSNETSFFFRQCPLAMQHSQKQEEQLLPGTWRQLCLASEAGGFLCSRACKLLLRAQQLPNSHSQASWGSSFLRTCCRQLQWQERQWSLPLASSQSESQGRRRPWGRLQRGKFTFLCFNHQNVIEELGALWSYNKILTSQAFNIWSSKRTYKPIKNNTNVEASGFVERSLNLSSLF